MDVGINLHDLRGSGRLGALARALGVNELEALGTVTVVWAETQDRELTMVTEKVFSEAVALHFDDPVKVLTAMVRARLVSPVETPDAGLGPNKTWLIHGNDRHVTKLQAYRANASAAGKASATARQRAGSKSAAKPSTAWERLGNQTVDDSALKPSTVSVQAPSKTSTLVTGRLDTGEEDLRAPAPDLSPASSTEIDPRSSVSSESKNEVALSASPSAAADALHVLDIKPPKRKERTPTQKKRSVNNAHLYRDLYEQAEGHQPAGLDQAFYGAMAKFSDKYGDDAQHIIAWAFQCPDKSFRAKGWPLPLIIEQAPRLWRELNDPNKAIANIAAPRQQQQLSLAAANEMAFTEFLARHGEVPNATR